MRKLRNDGIGATLNFAFGRFYLVRKIRRATRSKRRLIQPSANQSVIFTGDDPIAALKCDGVFTSIALRPAVLNKLLQAVNTAEVRHSGNNTPHEVVGLEEIRQYNKCNPTRPIVMAYLSSAELNAVALEIARDSELLRVAESYFGGAIKKVTWRIARSFVVEATDQYRENENQTAIFHYDVEDFDFLYAFFYLTDTDRNSGAHEMIIGSHKDKPLSSLLGSVRADRSIHNYYHPLERYLIIEGKRGSGFIEDTSAFHRARPPVSAERLVLQFRYT